ncbi:MAG: hypothetical protein J6V07_01955, partial [Clostridia bacterium]|nr:hypothetical protein [Clostridia bacterium]
GTALHLVAEWTSTDAAGEVVGKNYFKEYDAAYGEYEYVFLTGADNAYTFSGYTLSFQNNNGVVTPNGDNTGFVANKAGSFSMTMTPATGSPITVYCRVENRINGFTSGKNTDTGYAANFKNGIDGVIDAGRQNLIPHVLVTGLTNNTSATLPLSDIPVDITVEVEMNGSYEPCAAGNYTVQNGAITFTNDLLDGTKVRVTLTPKYALSAERAGQTKSFEYLLNSGVNVYSDAELYESYKNLSVNTINIQRDITAKLHASECACSDPAYGVATCSGDHKYPINQWGTGAYVRTPGTAAESITLNGNHYKLDGSTLPKIDTRNPGGKYDKTNNGYGGSGDSEQDANGLAYKTVNVQAGIISYLSPNGDTATGAQTLTVSDLYMTGGNTESPDLSVGVNGSTTDKERILVGSMNFHGITTRLANLTATNVTLQNMHISLFSTGSTEMAPTRLTTAITLDGVKIDNSFSNHLYNWGQVGVTIKNSELKQASGAAIHYDDSPLSTTDESLASFLSIDKATTITNLVTGTEPWFNAYGMVAAAGAIKTKIPTLINAANGHLDKIFPEVEQAYGKPLGDYLPNITPATAVTEDENGNQLFNLVCVIKEGTGDTDDWAQDKGYTSTGPAGPISYVRGRAHVRIIPAEITPENNFAICDFSAFDNALVPYACFDSRLYVNYGLDG